MVKFSYGAVGGGFSCDTTSFCVDGNATFFLKTPDVARIEEFYKTYQQDPAGKANKIIKSEYALLCMMNLLGLKTPTEVALLEWGSEGDGKSCIIKRKVGDGQGDKNQIQDREKGVEHDIDQLIRGMAVMHVLKVGDVRIGDPYNSFYVGRGRSAIYDPMLSSDHPKFSNGEYDLKGDKGMFYYPFKSASLIEEETVRECIEVNHEGCEFILEGIKGVAGFDEKAREFFYKVIFSENKEERDRVIKALGKVLYYYDRNKDEIERIARQTLPEDGEEILDRLSSFCVNVRNIAAQRVVDIAYAPDVRSDGSARPGTQVARSVPAALNENVILSLLSDISRTDCDDGRFNKIKSYLAGASQPKINLYSTTKNDQNNAAVLGGSSSLSR